jgi:trehalose 6-phosphate phosphatase
MVIELRPQGMDKGQALRTLIDQRKRQPSAVMFCGDDLGDVAAFDVVRTLRSEGVPGLTVFSGSAEVTELAQSADLVVNGPDGVVALLNSLADALS